MTRKFLVFLMAGLLVNAVAFADGPVPVIRVGGIDSHQARVIQGAEGQLQVALTAGAFSGVDADWWLVAIAGNSRFCYTLDRGWVLANSNSALVPVHQGPLRNLSATPVFDTAVLPDGDYTFYFAVDREMDGVLEMDTLSYDYVQVSVGLNANGFWEDPVNGSVAAGTLSQNDAGTISGALLLPPAGNGHLTGTVNGSHMTFTMSWDSGGSESGSGNFSFVDTGIDKLIFDGFLPSVGNFEISWRGPDFDNHTPAQQTLAYTPPEPAW